MVKKQARATEAAITKVELVQERGKHIAGELSRVERLMQMEKHKTKCEALAEYAGDITRLQNKRSQLSKSIDNLDGRSVSELQLNDISLDMHN